MIAQLGGFIFELVLALAVSAAASTGTQSTLTVTDTPTTTTIPPPQCFSTHTVCPLPARSLNGTWEIVGSEGVAGCMVGAGAGETAVFAVDYRSCRTATVNVRGFVVKIATFRFRTEGTAGAASLFLTRDLEGLVECRCRTASSLVAGTSTIEVVMPPVGVTEGLNSSNVSLKTYTTAAFESALQPEEKFPLDAPKMYFRVATPGPALILGVSQCVASPSDSPNDSHAVVLLDSGCFPGTLQVQMVPESQPNIFQFSTAAFKFVGSPEVHIRCDVVLCSSEPCGVCNSPTLRLRAQSEDDQPIVAWSSVLVEPGPSMMVMPGDIAEGVIRPVWTAEQRIPTQWLPVNVTVLGLFSEYTGQWLNMLAASVSAVLATMVAHHTIVARIHAVPIYAHSAAMRRLALGGAEALVLECAVEVPSEIVGSLAATRLNDNFFATFITELRASGVELPVTLQATWSSGIFVLDTTSSAATITSSSATSTTTFTTRTTSSATSTTTFTTRTTSTTSTTTILPEAIGTTTKATMRTATVSSTTSNSVTSITAMLLIGASILAAIGGIAFVWWRHRSRPNDGILQVGRSRTYTDDSNEVTESESDRVCKSISTSVSRKSRARSMTSSTSTEAIGPRCMARESSVGSAYARRTACRAAWMHSMHSILPELPSQALPHSGSDENVTELSEEDRKAEQEEAAPEPPLPPDPASGGGDSVPMRHIGLVRDAAKEARNAEQGPVPPVPPKEDQNAEQDVGVQAEFEVWIVEDVCDDDLH